MKVVTAEIMQQVDRRAITEAGIPGLQLMENAGRCCAAEIISRYGSSGRAIIVAGKGNNGGDGYVIARYLQEAGWRTDVCVVAERADIAGDALANLERLGKGCLNFCPNEAALAAAARSWREGTLVVDALFGTGLNTDVAGKHLAAIRLINGSGLPVVAVDIPSGVNGTTARIMGEAVMADFTVAFGFPKLGHVVYPGAENCGVVVTVDIGIPAKILAETPGYDYLDAAAARSLIRPRSPVAHKGSFGHTFIIAGSTGKTGAAAMAANSAVRGGSGLVTLAVPASLHHILEVKTTESMTVPIDDDATGRLTEGACGALMDAAAGKDAVALGPGIGWHQRTAGLVRILSAALSNPLVIDADGLNALSEQPEVLLDRCGRITVLTPHPGEMARLTGLATTAVEADRIGVALKFARQYGVWLVLKGARTVVAAPDGRLAINSTGNPGMASGGMGDVLTGLLAALLSQGYEPFDACCIGVYIHGHAADIVAADKGETGISAVDVQERIPYAFKLLQQGS